MKSPGIHMRILLASVLLIGATTFTLGYIGAKIAHQFAERRFAEHISFLAKYLALTAELGILIDDRPMLRNLAVNLMSEKDVVRVAILDSRGRELVRVPEGPSGAFPVMETPVLLTESREESKAFGSPEEAQDRLLGKVKISYSTAGIDQLWTTIVTYFIWLAAGLTGLAVLVAYFISHSLVAPVRGLAQVARRVAQGDLGTRALPGSLPETMELAKAFNVMLDSLDEHRRSLDQANERMRRQKTLAEMGEFSLMIAHEFKNPLSIIKSSLDVLKRDAALSRDNTMVAYIEDEIKRLNRLIGDFLIFSRPVTPAFRPTDLNAMLRETVARFEFQQAATACEIRTEIPSGPCFTHADPDLLIRALDNVIKNAFDANGSKGVIKVMASCPADVWTAEIADDGEGIAAEHMEKIFHPFFTTRAKGVGLGLAYASQAIRAHGGDIRAENLSEGGARFSVEIPVSPGNK